MKFETFPTYVNIRNFSNFLIFEIFPTSIFEKSNGSQFHRAAVFLENEAESLPVFAALGVGRVVFITKRWIVF